MVFNLRQTTGLELRFFGIFAVAYCAAFGITAEQHGILFNVRYLLLAVAAVTFLIPTVRIDGAASAEPRTSRFLILYLVLIAYGIAMSSLWGGSIFFSEEPENAIFLGLSVIYGVAIFGVLSALTRDPTRWASGMPTLSLFMVLPTLLVLFWGGLSLSPPGLNFQTIEGADLAYGQGFTKICVIAAVYFMVIATNERRAITLYGLSGFFMVLALLGGSRGELMAGLFALMFFLLRRPNAINMTLISAGALFLLVFVIQSGIWSEFAVFNRFASFAEGDFSMRDLLFVQALDLIGTGPCSLFGCGFNFFQIWHNYEFGLYPHNVFLEVIITFGLVIGGVATALSIFGAVNLYIRIGRNPLFYIFLVEFFSLQKSSSLIDFTTLPTFLCFAWAGARALGNLRTRADVRQMPLQPRNN